MSSIARFETVLMLLAVLGCSDEVPSAGAEGGPCRTDQTCDLGLTCASKLCVVAPIPPPAVSDASVTNAPDAAGVSHIQDAAATDVIVCESPGNSCSEATACCPGSTCVMDGASRFCAADCESNVQCASGCCAALQSGGKVCAPRAICESQNPMCGQPGDSCAQEACCPGSLCVGGASPACAAECTDGSQCASGCCARLQSGRMACAPASVCVDQDPCLLFKECLARRPVPGTGVTEACRIVSSKVDTVDLCSAGSPCPGGDCRACLRGTPWCLEWTINNHSRCADEFAARGLLNSGTWKRLDDAFKGLCM